jgi:hypothetical protein
MCIRNRFSNNPRLLMLIGMACLLLASLPRFIRIFAPGFTLLDAPLTPDQSDFAHGVLLGLSIGFMLLAVWRNAHRNYPAS